MNKNSPPHLAPKFPWHPPFLRRSQVLRSIGLLGRMIGQPFRPTEYGILNEADPNTRPDVFPPLERESQDQPEDEHE
jgi:hypothetical protein